VLRRIRILLDECVHAHVRKAFPRHVVRTVAEAGWQTTKDAPLLGLAASRFDVFVTVDRAFEQEFRRSETRLGLVMVVDLPSNRLESFLPIFDRLLLAANAVKPGEVIHVSARDRCV